MRIQSSQNGSKFWWLSFFAALVILSATTREAAAGTSSFVSTNTVIVGCTAGSGASAFAAVLPLFTAGVSGPAAPLVTPAVLASWVGIGCAVGVVSALTAIVTVWALEPSEVVPASPSS